MLKRFLTTDDSWILLAQRVTLGLVMFPHGAQKLLGWFGGHGFTGTMSFFTEQAGLPAPIALLVILAESLGALALILGAGSRLMALGIASVMLGAVATMHVQHGLFMNWFGAQAGEGFEYHLLALALAIPLVIRGGGLWSVDRAVAARLETSAAVPSLVRAARAGAASV